MKFDHGAIQRYGFDLDADHLRTLQFCEHAIQQAAPRPPVHPRVDRVPSTEALGQAAPLAAVLSHIKNRIQHLQVRHTYVTPLPGQAMFDLMVLGFSDFHHRSAQANLISVNRP